MDHDYALTVAAPSDTEAVPVNKPVKRKRTGQPSNPRRIWDKKRAKSRINIGVAFPRWRELRKNLGLQFDADLACVLLDR